MARLLKRPGTTGAARMMVADFDGLVRDGATFQLWGTNKAINDGGLIAFNLPDGLAAGISVNADDDGLYSLISFSPSISLRIGLEPQGDGVYAFRPALHHVQTGPELGPEGAGAKIS